MPSIQAILDSAITSKTRALLPPGITMVTEPLVLTGVSGLIVQGAGVLWSTPEVGSQLVWNGPPGQDMWRLENCREMQFRDFSTRVDAPLATVFHSISDSTLPHPPPTAMTWDHVWIDGKYKLGKGFQFSKVAADHNNSEMSFNTVYVRQADVCWSIEHGQSKAHVFVNCTALDANYGLVSIGSQRWYGGTMSALHEAAVWQQAPNDTLTLDGIHSEACGRFLITGQLGGPSQNSLPVTIQSVSFSLDALKPDGVWLSNGLQGPLIVRGCQTAGASVPVQAKIVLHAGTSGTLNRPCVAIIEGNGFQTEHPTGLEITGSDNARPSVRYEHNIRRRDIEPLYGLLPVFRETGFTEGFLL